MNAPSVNYSKIHAIILSNDDNQSYGKFIKCQKKYYVYLYALTDKLMSISQSNLFENEEMFLPMNSETHHTFMALFKVQMSGCN